MQLPPCERYQQHHKTLGYVALGLMKQNIDSKQKHTRQVNKFTAKSTTTTMKKTDEPDKQSARGPTVNPSPRAPSEGSADKSTLVQVTIKKSSTNSSKNTKPKETWDKLLQKPCNNGDNLENYGLKVDAITTLKFLLKELENKIMEVFPNDPCTEQIISDINHTIKFVKPVTEECSSINVQPNSYSTVHQNEQKQPTPRKLEHQLELSDSKLQNSMAQMEQVITMLYEEKVTLQTQLDSEKDTLKVLKKQLKKSEKKNKAAADALKMFITEKEQLTNENKVLKEQLHKCRQQPSEDIKELMRKLANQHNALSEKNIELNHELAVTKLETEKLKVLLNSRDRQLGDLRSELSAIQSVVNSQLQALHKESPTESECSESSTEIAEILKNATNNHKTPVVTKINNILNESLDITGEFKEMPVVEDELPERDESKKTPKKKQDFMGRVGSTLEELKKQVYDLSVTLPSPPRKFMSPDVSQVEDGSA